MSLHFSGPFDFVQVLQGKDKYEQNNDARYDTPAAEGVQDERFQVIQVQRKDNTGQRYPIYSQAKNILPSRFSQKEKESHKGESSVHQQAKERYRKTPHIGIGTGLDEITVCIKRTADRGIRQVAIGEVAGDSRAAKSEDNNRQCNQSHLL